MSRARRTSRWCCTSCTCRRCREAGVDARERFRDGAPALYDTTFEDVEAHVRDELTRMLGPGGFDADRDIAAVTVNRWGHGYSYGGSTLFDPPADGPEPYELARAAGGPGRDRERRRRVVRLRAQRDRPGASSGGRALADASPRPRSVLVEAAAGLAAEMPGRRHALHDGRRRVPRRRRTPRTGSARSTRTCRCRSGRRARAVPSGARGRARLRCRCPRASRSPRRRDGRRRSGTGSAGGSR